MPNSDSECAVGLVGIGLIGTVLAQRLLSQGYRVVGWDTDPERRQALHDLGGSAASDIAAVFQFQTVFLSLPNDNIVTSVLDEVLSIIPPASLVIDTSTGHPLAAVENATRLASRSIEYVDATISGSSTQLAAQQATFIVGGTESSFERCRPILAKLSQKVFYTGPAGSGARMKLVTNLVLGLNRAALAEGLAFASVLGLDLAETLAILRESAAYSRIMETKGEKMLKSDFVPQARLSQHLKDVDLIHDLGAENSMSLPLSTTHRELLRLCMENGWGDLDNSALIKAYFAKSGSEAAKG